MIDNIIKFSLYIYIYIHIIDIVIESSIMIADNMIKLYIILLRVL